MARSVRLWAPRIRDCDIAARSAAANVAAFVNSWLCALLPDNRVSEKLTHMMEWLRRGGAVTAAYDAPDILAQPYLQYVGWTREARLWFLPLGVIPHPGPPSNAPAIHFFP